MVDNYIPVEGLFTLTMEAIAADGTYISYIPDRKVIVLATKECQQ